MALYSYVCGQCGRTADKTAEIGTAQRMTSCAECGGVMRLRIGVGVHISASALETKGGQVREVDERESRWDKDMPAYKRMRHRGLQPNQIDGCAVLEDKVDDQFDVQHQDLYSKGVSRERIIEGADQAEQLLHDGVPR